MSFHTELQAWVALIVGVLLFVSCIVSSIIVLLRRYTAYLSDEQLTLHSLFLVSLALLWVIIIQPALLKLGFIT